MKSSSAQCHICKRGPYLLCNLYSHLRQVHYCKEDEVRDVRDAIKRAKYRVLQPRNCDVCGKVYYSPSGLRKHKRNTHKERVDATSTSTESDHVVGQVKNYVICPGCDGTLRSNLELAAHCYSDHNDGISDFTIIEAQFSCWKTFEIWKTRKERETFTKLVRRTSRKSTKGTTHVYACQYSGRRTARTDSMKIREKKHKRMSKHCPCFAKATQRFDKTVYVLACFGHFGHQVNSADLPLSRDDEMVVKSMILSGMPYNKIVSQLRITRWNVEAPQELQPRLCYLTNRDVSNIAARHGLLDVKTHDNSSCSGSLKGEASPERFAEEMSDEEVIVDY
ncbi:hypothetical protein RB195_017650 [Necator americanus]|uniref:C2H2-type domain-containing protein n=1 Tax=Necator americanus TaxID=51031 RepID=A0ABR1C9T5_NECAM